MKKISGKYNNKIQKIQVNQFIPLSKLNLAYDNNKNCQKRHLGNNKNTQTVANSSINR